KVDALKQRGLREPAFPDGSPPRRPIMGAWKTSHPGVPPPSEIRAHRHGGWRLTRALGQNRKPQRLNQRLRRTLGFETRVATDLQQAYGQRGQQAQQADQTVNGLQLPFFYATATCEALMIVLNQPPMSIPLDPLPGLFKRRGGHRGHQEQFRR